MATTLSQEEVETLRGLVKGGDFNKAQIEAINALVQKFNLGDKSKLDVPAESEATVKMQPLKVALAMPKTITTTDAPANEVLLNEAQEFSVMNLLMRAKGAVQTPESTPTVVDEPEAENDVVPFGPKTKKQSLLEDKAKQGVIIANATAKTEPNPDSAVVQGGIENGPAIVHYEFDLDKAIEKGFGVEDGKPAGLNNFKLEDKDGKPVTGESAKDVKDIIAKAEKKCWEDFVNAKDGYEIKDGKVMKDGKAATTKDLAALKSDYKENGRTNAALTRAAKDITNDTAAYKGKYNIKFDLAELRPKATAAQETTASSSPAPEAATPTNR